MINAALRSASAIALDGPTVLARLDLHARPGDLTFALAWTRSLRALAPHERSSALAGVTGHVAESVVELLLADLGYHPVHDFTGRGRDGVDLPCSPPATDHVLAIDGKGTLRPGSVLRLSERAVAQNEHRTCTPGRPHMARQQPDCVRRGLIVVVTSRSQWASRPTPYELSRRKLGCP